MSERVHELKCWPEPFAALLDGSKTFEYRKADRPYAVGDVLDIEEYDPNIRVWGATLRRRRLFFRVTYVLHGGVFGVPHGFVVLAIVPVGDDKSLEDCKARFDNANAFRGAPAIPTGETS